MNIGNSIDIILDLIYPPRCPFCERLLRGGEKTACRACRAKLPCVGTEDLLIPIKNTDVCAAPFYYEQGVREALLRYKFHGEQANVRPFSDFVVKCIDENRISCDIITWVPLSRRRLMQRGYDQARLLARFSAKKLGIPCERLLKKTRDTKAQSTMGNAENRAKNAKGVYTCLNEELIRGRRIILIDDIITTGATVSECAGMLKKAGAAAVYAVSVARGRK